MQQPTIHTEHLTLRPLRAQDVDTLYRLLNEDPRIAAMSVKIPYPCPLATVESWIAALPEHWESGKNAEFAICTRRGGRLMGVIGLSAVDTLLPKVGYWLGAEFWRQGFGTEANRALCRFAFQRLGLAHIMGCHLASNQASARVLLKSGFRCLGPQRVFLDELQREETVVFYQLCADAIAAATA